MTIISTTVGRNPFKEMEYPSIVNKTVLNAVLGYNLKNDRRFLFVSKANNSISQ